MQQYAELIQAFQTYFEQENLKGKWIPTDRQTYEYFLQVASTTKSSTPRPPAQPAAPPPISIPQPIFVQAKPIEKSEPAPEVKAPPKEVMHQKVIAPETLTTEITTDFSELRAFFQEKLPHVVLSPAVPDDAQAKLLALRWKAPSAEIVILSFSDHPQETAFLTNISVALGSAKVIPAIKIEEEKRWNELLKAENLRLVIASHNRLHALPELMKHHHEDTSGKHRLDRIPLFLLSDLSLYMQQPSLKADLWRQLCC